MIDSHAACSMNLMALDGVSRDGSHFGGSAGPTFGSPDCDYKQSITISTVLIIISMLMDVVQSLRHSGLGVEGNADAGAAGVDGVLEVTIGDQRARFAVKVKGRAPYPHEVGGLEPAMHRLDRMGNPLLVAPFVSEPLARILTDAGWSWADEHGNFDLRAPGLVLRQRRTGDAPARTGKTLPQGSGSFAVIRTLVRTNDTADMPRVTALAAMTGVSQPRASQILRHLSDLGLAATTGHGRWVPDREALLDRFLAEYPGPGGSEQYFYSLESPTDVAVRASQASTPGRPIAVSADVGPDLIAPWRRPSQVILYTAHAIDPADLDLTDAQGRHDANVIIRMPGDSSVFPVPALSAQVRGKKLSLADPLQQAWDLGDLGGADRAEAAGRMREWLLARH